ncbi:MAG: S8 family serine peptidase [Candidatus Krumholzibacteriia bacterium]
MPRSQHILALTLLVSLLAAVAMAAPTDPREFVPVQNGFSSSGQKVLPYASDRLLVQFTEDAMEMAKLDIPLDLGAQAPQAATGLRSVDNVVRAAGLRSVERPYIKLRDEEKTRTAGIDRWFMLRFDGRADVAQLAKRLEQDPNVAAVSLDWLAFPAAVPNDPLYPDHWGHNNTGQLPGLDWGGTYEHIGPPVGTPGFDANAQAAWDNGYGAAGVVIAIIDSGVDVGHPDLRQVTGYDFGDNDSNPDDNSAQAGHGTCCAGVAASMRNSLGSAGIAADCSIMPLKVANSAGSMYFSSIQNALYYAADNGADVISMSLGAAISSDSATNTALQYAYNAGCVILAATGNENASTISYPAINGYVIGVGAASPCGERKRSSSSSSEVNPGVNTDPNGYTCDGERWWGSNYGVNTRDAAGAVDLIAPTILPTTDIAGSGGYTSGDYEGFFNGTSCATPYAAGVAALVIAANPTWSNAQVRDQLVQTCQDVTSVESGSGWDRYTGYGMIDADAAVGGGGGPVPPVAAFTGTPTSGDAPLIVSFTDQSSGSPTSWSWSFGDGGTSSSQNPSHTYTTAGTYTVTLTATNSAGSDGETKSAYITVTQPGAGLVYATPPYSTGFESGTLDASWLTASTTEGRIQISTANTPHSGSRHLLMDDSVNGSLYATNTADLHLNLAGQSQVDLEFWWKDFGDETHTQDGVSFSNNGGSSFVRVQALAGGSYSDNTWRSFQLDVDALAAANGLSLTSTFVVRFEQYDNYSIATDGFAFDDISVTASSGVAPTAAFTASVTSGDAPLAVQFTDQSTDAPTAWSWNFGDGGTATSQNPSHTYTAAGTYTVSLTASNAFGSDVETKTSYITVTQPAGGQWETITYDDFESGWGSYTDGGGDCALYTGGTYAYQGSAAADIQDNSGVASSFYHTSSYNLTGYTELEVDFYFYAVSMEVNEDFWLQVYNGSSWVTVASWARGTSFNNNTFYHVTVPLTPAQVNFASNGKLRFLCDASGNADDVYIDQITFSGLTAAKSLGDDRRTPDLPSDFALAQNHPNPFNPMTTISFALPTESRVRLQIFDVRGRLVQMLADGTMPAGRHEVQWDARRAASGVYFYRLDANGFSETRKMSLLK